MNPITVVKNQIDTSNLLQAALEHRLNDLAAHTGVSVRHLADRTIALIDDAETSAAHPEACRRLRAWRDLTRTRRAQASMPLASGSGGGGRGPPPRQPPPPPQPGGARKTGGRVCQGKGGAGRQAQDGAPS